MNKKEIMELVDEYAKVWSMFTSTCEVEQINRARAAIEAALPDDGWNHAGHFYNLVMHALMDVGANHGWAKFRLNDILEQLEALKKSSPATALPDLSTVPELIDIADLKDRLVAISEAVAYQDDRAAQAILGELLRMLSAAPEPAQAEQAQPAERKSEQAAFEDWLYRVSPSGDVTEVQRQWEASSEYADLLDSQVAPKPMKWREASTLLSEHLEGEMTGDDYIIVKAVERFHGIGD